MLLKFTTRLQTKYGHLGRVFYVVVTQTVVLTSPCGNLELAGGENELCKVKGVCSESAGSPSWLSLSAGLEGARSAWYVTAGAQVLAVQGSGRVFL